MAENLKAVLLKCRQSGNTKFKFRAVFSLPPPYFVHGISVGNSEISKTTCYLSNISPCYSKLHSFLSTQNRYLTANEKNRLINR